MESNLSEATDSSHLANTAIPFAAKASFYLGLSSITCLLVPFYLIVNADPDAFPKSILSILVFAGVMYSAFPLAFAALIFGLSCFTLSPASTARGKYHIVIGVFSSLSVFFLWMFGAWFGAWFGLF